MGILKNKQIRFECDSKNYHSDICLEGILDQAGLTYKECFDIGINYYGWKKIKGKWYCPKCAEKINKSNHE
jgi:hypothetical protein